jgi:8-oxo-dGTP diphosphatase
MLTKRERFKLSLSVFLFLIKDNKVLLIKRGNTGWMDGFYSVPAGALDGNEPLTKAVCREAHEEVAVAVDPKNVKLVHTMHCMTERSEWVGAFFVADSWEGDPKVNEPEKYEEVKWNDLDELPENTIPYVKQAIESLKNGISYSEYGWN